MDDKITKSVENEINQKDGMQEVENVFKLHLQQQFNQGIKVGLKTMSRVILDELDNKSKPLSERISNVKRMCRVSLKKENNSEKPLDK